MTTEPIVVPLDLPSPLPANEAFAEIAAAVLARQQREAADAARKKPA